MFNQLWTPDGIGTCRVNSWLWMLGIVTHKAWEMKQSAKQRSKQNDRVYVFRYMCNIIVDASKHNGCFPKSSQDILR